MTASAAVLVMNHHHAQFCCRRRPALRTATFAARPRGFTLIELLTVISIIALLATLGAGLAGVASRKAKESSIQAELGKLVTAIENYRADLNQYPPDNARNGVNVNPAVHPLFYELVGTYSTNNGNVYLTVDRSEQVTAAEIQSAFGRGGFVNSAVYPERPRAYLRDLRPRQIREIRLSGANDIELLAVPVDWPRKWLDQAPLRTVTTDPRLREINPWHYVSTRPTNNPASFDLWAIWATGRTVNGTNEYRFFGNWKD